MRACNADKCAPRRRQSHHHLRRAIRFPPCPHPHRRLRQSPQPRRHPHQSAHLPRSLRAMTLAARRCPINQRRCPPARRPRTLPHQRADAALGAEPRGGVSTCLPTVSPKSPQRQHGSSSAGSTYGCTSNGGPVACKLAQRFSEGDTGMPNVSHWKGSTGQQQTMTSKPKNKGGYCLGSSPNCCCEERRPPEQ